MTRKTRDLCQDCWQNAHPGEYAPMAERIGICDECRSDYESVVRSIIADETVIENCGDSKCATCAERV